MVRRVLPKSVPTFSLAEKSPEDLIEKRVFSDPVIPAYFIAVNKPFKVIPHKNLSGQVDFRVEGFGIDEAQDEFYADTHVGVSTYVRALKGLRSAIFSLKGPKLAARG
ncbi:MAG TPA: hypothetical protein VLX29_05385 [Nitrospirota bacterium]|nr:hypothetical protein [Nitrospirota bacterium]